MNYNTHIIKLDVFDVSLSREFIVGTKLKTMINDKVNDVGNVIINHILYKIDNLKYRYSTMQIICYIKTSMRILNNLYSGTHDFKLLKQYLSLIFISRIHITRIFYKYYILSELMDLLEIDRRMLFEDDDWLKVMFNLRNYIERNDFAPIKIASTIVMQTVKKSLHYNSTPDIIQLNKFLIITKTSSSQRRGHLYNNFHPSFHLFVYHNVK